MEQTREYPDRPIVGVGVVVIKEDKVLLIRRGNEPNKGKWSIPGGGQELGETLKETAKREIREETGIEIKELKLLDVVDLILPDSSENIQFHYTLIDYKAKWKSGECKADNDALEARWFSLNELNSLDLWHKTIEIIKQV